VQQTQCPVEVPFRIGLAKLYSRRSEVWGLLLMISFVSMNVLIGWTGAE